LAENNTLALFESLGIKINGFGLVDLEVSDINAFNSSSNNGLAGLAESYIDGIWNCKSMDIFFSKLFNSPSLLNKIPSHKKWLNKLLGNNLLDRLHSIMEERSAFYHDLYTVMLDEYMNYSCGIWDRDTISLGQAQLEKMSLICSRCSMRPGTTVLELGCNYGGMIKYIQSRYFVPVTGCSSSLTQISYAKEVYGLDLIYSGLLDYKFTDKFDLIIAIESLEYLKSKKYKAFFHKIHTQLNKHGKVFIQCKASTSSHEILEELASKYFLPYCLVELEELISSIKGKFKIEQIWSIGSNYPSTISGWIANLEKCSDLRYNPKTIKLWKFYLSCLSGCFLSKKLDVLQILLSKT
jgi:cyclopropane-fatty-acyl-phospholipid synthase